MSDVQQIRPVPGQPDAAGGPVPARVALPRAPMGVLASWSAARSNLLGIIPEAATRLPIVSGRTVKRWHMVTEPDAIRAILLERLDHYPKSDVTKDMLRPAIGESLFIAEGAHWRWQRRSAAPAFSHRNVSDLAPIMAAAAERSCARIAAAGPRAIDMAEDMVRTTFDVISEVTFSGEGGMEAETVRDAVDGYAARAGRISLLDVLGLPGWIPRPGRDIAQPDMNRTREIADATVEARRARGPGDVPDLLDLLLAGEDSETQRRMSTAELRDNLLTFIVAGHETTALTLAWALYLCAFDPAVQERARAEARTVLQGRSATGADVARLPFIRMIVDEALRLYPPAGMLSRTALAEDTLCGTQICEGDTVIVPIYALHRNRLLWDAPDHFRPERFADRKAVPRYSYLPFGDGPRICIGASFALQEAVIILATLLARFRFTPVRGRDPRPVLILTTRPEGGVWLEAAPLDD